MKPGQDMTTAQPGQEVGEEIKRAAAIDAPLGEPQTLNRMVERTHELSLTVEDQAKRMENMLIRLEGGVSEVAAPEELNANGYLQALDGSNDKLSYAVDRIQVALNRLEEHL